MLELNFSNFPTLETERLLLREITQKDMPAILALRSHPQYMKYLGRDPLKNEEEAKAFVQIIIDGVEKNEGITWGICKKEKPDALIGSIGFWRFFKQHFRGEIGYGLHPDYQQQGFMSEAATKILNYGFEELKLYTVEANIDPDNKGSEQLLLRMGFVQEGRTKNSYFYNGEFTDTTIFGLMNPKGFEQPATNS